MSEVTHILQQWLRDSGVTVDNAHEYLLMQRIDHDAKTHTTYDLIHNSGATWTLTIQFIVGEKK